MITVTESLLDVAIVGMGPRGLSVLERLIVPPDWHRLLSPIGRSTCTRSSPASSGAGRIWRTDQPQALIMKTAAVEVSLLRRPRRRALAAERARPCTSGYASGRRHGRGTGPLPIPTPPAASTGNTSAPFTHSIVANLPAGVEGGAGPRPGPEPAPRARRALLLTISGNREITVDKVVLTTGSPAHPLRRPGLNSARLHLPPPAHPSSCAATRRQTWTSRGSRRTRTSRSSAWA